MPTRHFCDSCDNELKEVEYKQTFYIKDFTKSMRNVTLYNITISYGVEAEVIRVKKDRMICLNCLVEMIRKYQKENNLEIK